ENGATGKHEVGALGADASIGDAIFVTPGQQSFDYARHFIIDHPAAVDAATLVTPQLEMDAGDGRYRARGAEQVDVAGAKPAGLGHETIDQGRDLRDHRRVGFGGDLVPAVALRQRDHSHGQRRPSLDPRQWRSAPTRGGAGEAYELRGTAADVEQDHAIGARINQPRPPAR